MFERFGTAARETITLVYDEAQPPLTRAAKVPLRAALEEAIAMGAARVRPEHLLLGLTTDDEMVEAILGPRGADAEVIRAAVYDALGGLRPPFPLRPSH